jgi:hypothetical protein
LLGIELVILGERDADLLGVEQYQKLFLVGEVRAGVVAEGITAAAIALGRRPAVGDQQRIGRVRENLGRNSFNALLEYAQNFGRWRCPVKVYVPRMCISEPPSLISLLNIAEEQT